MKDNKSHRSITRLHLTSVTGDYRSRQLPSGSGMAYNVRECLCCLYMTTNIGELTIAYILCIFLFLWMGMLGKMYSWHWHLLNTNMYSYFLARWNVYKTFCTIHCHHYGKHGTFFHVQYSGVVYESYNFLVIFHWLYSDTLDNSMYHPDTDLIVFHQWNLFTVCGATKHYIVAFKTNALNTVGDGKHIENSCAVHS